MRKINSRNSLVTHFLPTRVRCRESHVQYNLNPARCQRTTVSGCTRTSARFHPGHSRRKIIQNNLSGAAKRGRGYLCFKTESCCRKARFSNSRSLRELVKGKRWLLLTRWLHLTARKKQQLNELFALNRRVMKAYLLKESLDRLWTYRYEGAMLRYLKSWIDQLRWQRLKCLRENYTRYL